MKVPVATLLALASLGFTTSQARAVEPLDTFSARLGGYITQFDTKIRADGTTSRGSDIDLGKDLDLGQSNAIAHVGLTWRPWQNHEFGVGYYQNNKSGDRRIQRDISFNGTTYPTQSTLHAESGIDTYEAYYVWWAANHDTWALGPRLGLVWYRIDMSLELTLDANGNTVTNQARNDVSANLPVPTLGGSWRWVPAGNSDWRISADAGWFKANSGGIDGDVWFGRVGVEWFPWERWGFALDYTGTKIKVDSTKDTFNGNFDFLDSGFRLSGVYRF